VPALWLRHDASFAHDIPGHPERPERLRALEAEMVRHDWFGCTVADAPAATRELLLSVHSEDHVDRIETLSRTGGGRIDADTSVVPATWEAALRAAGGAAALVDALLTGEARTGVSALRPPGHHAEPDRAMGFCFFDNVAVAARRATEAHGLERVLILDWDVHHGNGTNAIFHTAPDVLFVSIHESPLYPGTGPASDVGAGAGEGYTVNLPVPAGSGDPVWCSLVEHVGAALVRTWSPELVLVSAGFDAHRDDPLASCTVTEAGFARMAASLRRASDEVGAPLGLVLEGGYDLGALSRSMAELMPVLVGEAPGGVAEPGLPRHPLAEQALARLERWWPGLGAGAGTGDGAGGGDGAGERQLPH
jgi:acetoin utilization deacetylase AcuC-like enzyme